MPGGLRITAKSPRIGSWGASHGAPSGGQDRERGERGADQPEPVAAQDHRAASARVRGSSQP